LSWTSLRWKLRKAVKSKLACFQQDNTCYRRSAFTDRATDALTEPERTSPTANTPVVPSALNAP